MPCGRHGRGVKSGICSRDRPKCSSPPRVTTIVLDKTGTVTRRLSLTGVSRLTEKDVR